MTAHDLRAMMAVGGPPRFGERSATGCDYFDYAAGQPNLFLLMNFKQLLVKEHGLDQGFELYRRTIVKQNGAAVTLRRLDGHHAYCKAHAQDFFEIAAAGEPFTIFPPRVIGAGNHRPLVNTTRALYVARLEDALVRGRSSITEMGDVALADYQGEELGRIDDELEFDSSVFHRSGEQIWTIAQDREPMRLDRAFSLLGCKTDFFGDWLAEAIPKYVAATLSGRVPPVPILIDACMPRTHRQALELMLAPAAEIIEVPAFETVHAGSLWTSPSLGYSPFHQKFTERFKWDYLMSSPKQDVPVVDEMCRRADLVLGPPWGPSRVFLARKEFRHRKLVNRAEIEAIAEARGFAIVYPEDFDFAEQARLLRRARFVVAPEGSALFLSVFLSRDAKVCILNHQYTEGLVAYGGDGDDETGDVTIITGPQVGPQRGSPQDVDYAIDPELFRDFLETWGCAPAE
jgi:capsular polysaccharide biosynthesis protein